MERIMIKDIKIDLLKQFGEIIQHILLASINIHIEFIGMNFE